MSDGKMSQDMGEGTEGLAIGRQLVATEQLVRAIENGWMLVTFDQK
jgi:hypothetical protein